MEHASKLAFLERIFGVARYHPNTKEVEFFSPFCRHHKPKLSINLDTDHWRCWISGRNGKKLFYPIKEADGSRSDIKEYIEKHKAKNVVVSNYKAVEAVEITWPAGYLALPNCKNSMIGKRAYRYLKRRGISEIDILRYKIGVSTESDSVVFPSFDKKGKLNFFTYRTYDGEYKLPFVPKGYKNTIILNELNIDWKKPIVLVEGFIDMLKSIRNTIPLFGSFLIEDSLLFEKIMESGVDVTLGFDPDAWKKVEYNAKRLSRYDVSVYTVDIGEYEDIGALSRQQFLEIYENRTFWSPEGSFIRKLRDL